MTIGTVVSKVSTSSSRIYRWSAHTPSLVVSWPPFSSTLFSPLKVFSMQRAAVSGFATTSASLQPSRSAA
jgi:hypothetical protein